MLYIHHCTLCDKVHILNGHKKCCPKCGTHLTELPISFLQYTEKSPEERERIVNKAGNC